MQLIPIIIGFIRYFTVIIIFAALLNCSNGSGKQKNTTQPCMSLNFGATCSEDYECASGFCDLNLCVIPEGVYGQDCVPAPKGPDGLRDGKLHTCGAYLCLKNRCRSCSSDEQCQSELGSPNCYASQRMQGMRCGKPLK